MAIGKTNFPPGGVDTSDANAVAGDVLLTKTAYVNGVKITGTIPTKALETFTPSTVNQTITAGQYLGGVQTILGDADLLASNIKSGVNIFGVAGTYLSPSLTGDAVVGDVLASKTFYNTDPNSKLTGTMTNRGAYNITPSASNQAIPAGYHNGSGVVAGDADLSAGNIKSGVNIFGVDGTYEGAAYLQLSQFSYTTNITTLSYSGGGVAYIYNAYNRTVAVPFNVSLVVSSSVITIDGVSLGVSYYLRGYSYGTSKYRYQAGNLQSDSINNVSYSGPGIAFIRTDYNTAIFEIYFKNSLASNSSGQPTIDGLSFSGFLAGYCIGL